MGETMAKQQSHIHSLREDIQRTYQCLLEGQKQMAMTVLEAALGLESSEEVEDKEDKQKAMILEATHTVKGLMDQIKVLKA